MREHRTASELARGARESGWEKIGNAWLCKACVRKFRRLDLPWVGAKEVAGGNQ